MNFNTLQDTNGDPRPTSDLPFITLRGWDDTGVSEGLSGRYGVDTTYNNDSITNEFSSETEAATIEIVSVNDLSVFAISSEGDGQTFTTRFTEEQAYVRIVDPDSVLLTDSDHATLESITITVTNPQDPGAEMLAILPLEPLPAGPNISIDQNTNVASVSLNDSFVERVQLVMSVYDGDPLSQSRLILTAPPGGQRVSVAAYEALVRGLVYWNTNLEPNNATRIIQFDINDSEDVNSFVRTLITIELLNDNAPVLTNYLRYLEFTEGEPLPVSVASDNLTLTDMDHNEFFFMENATVQLYPVPVAEAENVSVDTAVVPPGYSISQDYDPSTGVLLILGSAPVSVYEALLQSAVYQNSIEEPLPGVRMITMRVSDGRFSSNLQSLQVNVLVVNDQPPVVTTASEPFVYTERTAPISISENLTLSDSDSGNFLHTNLSFAITNPFDGDLEVLNVTTFGGVEAQFENATLLLMGPAPIPSFQTTFQTLTYTNLAEEPTPGVRQISVQSSDGDLASEEEFIQIRIQLVNDPPVIDLNGPFLPGRDTIVNYIEGRGTLPVTENVTITDNDHNDLAQIMVRIINPLDAPNEILSVNATVAEEVNITATFDPETAILVLTGNSSLEDYQDVLQTLAYENTEANPGFPNTDQRMVEFVVFDGEDYSLPAELLVTFESVNDAPILDLNGDAEGRNFSTTFVEEGSPAVLTDPDVVLLDIDNSSLAYVRLAILNVLDGENEVLRVSSNLSEQLDLAFYSYQDGVLLIEGLGLVENFRAAVASVTYENLADEPNYETRLVSFTASDGLRESKTFYTAVKLTPVNDPPRLTIAGGREFHPLL